MTQLITIKLTKQQFDLLKTKLNSVVSNVGYFPRKNMLEAANAPVLELNLDQYTSFKQALSTMTTGDAAKFLDTFFEQGEPQAHDIIQQLQAQQMAMQTGLNDLQEVKVEDIKKAAKAKAKAAPKKRKA